MKYSVLKYALLIVFAGLICACLPSQHEKAQTSKPVYKEYKEYLVQFRQGTSRDEVEAVLKKHGISSFSYLNSSQKRGYIIQIDISCQDSDVLYSLNKEKMVKNIDKNYTRKAY